MNYIKKCVFFLLVSIGGIAYSMPAPYGDKEKAEEYVRDRQGTTKEQGQGTTPDKSDNSTRNGSNVRRN